METTKDYNSDFTIPPSFAHCDEQFNDISFTSQSLRSSTFVHHIPPDPVYSSSHGRLTSVSFAASQGNTHMDHTRFVQGANSRMTPIDRTSEQSARGASVVLGMRWLPTHSYFIPRHLALDPQWTPSETWSGALLSASNEAINIAPTDQVALLCTQPEIPESRPSLASSAPYYFPDPSINFYSMPSANNAAPSPSLSGSTGDHEHFVINGRQSGVHHSPEKNHPGRPRSQNRGAVNIGGLWIDKDDISTRADPCNNMISVHECQWEKSSNPCGMWIASSRSRVGAHIRKWHRKQREEDSARCLWDGCAKKMAMYSINRHVVTVHFGEGFYCQECRQEFSRKDVYRQHTEKSEMCRGAVAAAIYSKKCKTIDARLALQTEASLGYAGR